jgi:hypothetical protein
MRQTTHTHLSQLELAKAFSLLGVSFKALFPDPIETYRAYEKHNWIVTYIQDSVIIQAVPPLEMINSSFWEVWHRQGEEEIYHHVMFAYLPPVDYHDIYDSKRKGDTMIPEELKQFRWYVVEQELSYAWGVQALLAEGQIKERAPWMSE